MDRKNPVSSPGRLFHPSDSRIIPFYYENVNIIITFLIFLFHNNVTFFHFFHTHRRESMFAVPSPSPASIKRLFCKLHPAIFPCKNASGLPEAVIPFVIPTGALPLSVSFRPEPQAEWRNLFCGSLRQACVLSASQNNYELLRSHPCFRLICQCFSTGNRSSMQASALQRW